jgi:ATP-dependent DNA helicase RecG
MEVESPGGLVAEVALDALVRGERVHRSRNPRLVRALVDLGAVRDQGEGIPRMFAEMEGLFLPDPTLSSDRRAFRVVLRNTPTLSIEDREWVASLGSEDLSNQEFRALLESHRHGRVDNARLRDLTGLDTLTASRLLGRLRDRGLLMLHGGGAASYYTLVGRAPMQAPVRNQSEADRRESGADRGESTSDRGELGSDRGDLPADGGEPERLRASLPSAVAALVRHLGPRPRRDRLRASIVEICRVRAWRPGELAAVLGLGRGDKLVARHLGPMVEAGLLERTHPETPNHPDQGYRVPQGPPSSADPE